MEEVSAIPQEAWVQAVFVCLFVIFMLVLLRILLNHFRQEQDDLRDWMAAQNENWRKEIDKLNEKWQGWMAAQEAIKAAEEKRAFDRLTEAIQQNNKGLQTLTDTVCEHDRRMHDSIKDAHRRGEEEKRRNENKAPPEK